MQSVHIWHHVLRTWSACMETNLIFGANFATFYLARILPSIHDNVALIVRNAKIICSSTKNCNYWYLQIAFKAATRTRPWLCERDRLHTFTSCLPTGFNLYSMIFPNNSNVGNVSCCKCVL